MATTLHVSHERINYLDQCYMTEPPWETGWWIKSVWVFGNTSWMVQKGCSKNHLHFFFSPLLHSLLLFLSELRWQCFDLSFFDDWQIDMLLKTGLGKKLTFFTPTLFSLTVRGSSQQTHHHPHQQQQTWKKRQTTGCGHQLSSIPLYKTIYETSCPDAPPFLFVVIG